MDYSFWQCAGSVHHHRLIMLVDPVTKDPGEAEVLNASFASVLSIGSVPISITLDQLITPDC